MFITGRSTFTVLLVTLCIGAWGAPAAEAQLSAPSEAAQLELGPLSVYPSVRIVDMGQDQNVYNSTVGAQDDFTFTLATRALGVVKLGLNELLFATGSDYVWFKEQASERSTNGSYAVRFNLSASRFKPYVGAERVHTRTRPNAEIDTRAARINETVLGGANFNLTERTAISATARYGAERYNEDAEFHGVALYDPLNRESWMYSGGVRYAITPLTTLAVNGSYSADTFPHSPLRNSKSYSVTPVLEFAPEAAIRGTFSAGYQRFSPDDPLFADVNTLIFEGGLNWSLMTRTTFDVSGRRGINYSYLDTEPMYIQTGLRVSVTQRLFGPLGVQGSAERQHLSYRWQIGVPPTPGRDTREDTYDVLGAGAVVDLGRGFHVFVGVENARRRSVEDLRQNFKRTRVISNINVGL